MFVKIGFPYTENASASNIKVFRYHSRTFLFIIIWKIMPLYRDIF